MNTPRISVLMPVYNGEPYLNEAMDSILNQTFRDFEFIIINDNSTDRSAEIIKSFNDDRIKLINNEKKIGLVNSLNVGIDLALGEYIARMDSDDISHEVRFEKQIRFLDNNPEVGVCGTWIKMFGEIKTKNYKPVCDPAMIKAALLFGCGIMHPTAMIRRSVLTSYDIKYDPKLIRAEDWDFWYSISLYSRIVNLPEILLSYRVRKAGLTIQANAKKQESDHIYALIYRRMLDDFGIFPSPDNLDTHRLVCSSEPIKEIVSLSACHRWLLQLQLKNRENHTYDQKALDSILAGQFLFVCKKAAIMGFASWHFFWNNTFFDHSLINKTGVIKLFVRCLLKR